MDIAGVNVSIPFAFADEPLFQQPASGLSQQKRAYSASTRDPAPRFTRVWITLLKAEKA
jgi:hypothetical protein